MNIFFPTLRWWRCGPFCGPYSFFWVQLQGRAIIFFVDNTHSLGCLLKRSSSFENEPAQRRHGGASVSVKGAAISQSYGILPHVDFEQLSESMKESMNSLARDIWNFITHFDLLVWWEYVNTHSTAADPPATGFWPDCAGLRIGDHSKELRSYEEFCTGKKVEEARKRAASAECCLSCHLQRHRDKSHTSEYFHFIGSNIRDDSCACEEQLPSTQNVVASLTLPLCAPFKPRMFR